MAPKKNSQNIKNETETEVAPIYTYIENVKSCKVVKAMYWTKLEEQSFNTLSKYHEVDFSLTVNYKRSNNPKDRRLYVSLGLQNLQREVRGILYHGSDYYDLDFSKCHPTIILEMAIEYGLNCPELSKYVDTINVPEKVKNSMYVWINDKENTTEQNPLYREILAIRTAIYQKEEFAEFREESVDNPIGKSFSNILRYRENLLLEQAINFFKGKLDIVALVFDGLIVHIKNKKILDEYLKEFNKTLNKSKLVIKPWIDPSTLEYWPYERFNQDGLTFENLIASSNKVYSSINKLLYKLRPYVLQSVRYVGDTYIVKNNNNIISIEKTDTNKHVRYYYYDENDKKKAMRLSELLSIFYQYILFSSYTPFEPEINQFSIFQGFKADHAWQGRQEEDWLSSENLKLIEPILHHIRVVLADNDENIYQYLLNWLTFVCSPSAEKTDKMILMHGDEGIGKSCFIEFIRDKVLGTDLCFAGTGLDSVCCRFNSHLSSKKLVILEELKSDENHDAKVTADTLKDLITNSKITIERKSINRTSEVSAINFIGFSNYEFTIPNVPGLNRRLVILQANPVYKNNFEYFSKLIKCFNEPKVAKIFLEYIRSIPKNRSLLLKVVKSKAKLEAMWKSCDFSLKSVLLFIVSNKLEEAEDFLVTSKTLLDVLLEYKQITYNINHGFRVNFGKRLAKLKCSIIKSGSNSIRYKFNVKEFLEDGDNESLFEIAKEWSKLLMDSMEDNIES